MDWYFFIITIIVSLLTLLITTVIIFRHIWIRESKIRKCFLNLCITGFTLIILFLVIEVFFRFFVIQTDKRCFTLAAKLWVSKYWVPINSLGYRDIEQTESRLKGKKIIFVVGDSNIAGVGIKNYKDRFSNILQEKLGEDYVVINIAKPGWGTEDEYNAILYYPNKPDIIILCHYGNDIISSAERMGFGVSEYMWSYIPPTPGMIKYLFNTSYSFNYCYYRLCSFYKDRHITSYSDYLRSCFSNETIWQVHKRSLLNIINYAKNQNIELIVLSLPFLKTRGAIEFSKSFTSKIVGFMNLNKVTAIDLTDRLIGRDPRELTVNSFDDHPSVKLHKEIGNLLVEYVTGLKSKYICNEHY